MLVQGLYIRGIFLILGRNLFILENKVTNFLSNRLISALKDFNYNSLFPKISWTTDNF